VRVRGKTPWDHQKKGGIKKPQKKKTPRGKVLLLRYASQRKSSLLAGGQDEKKGEGWAEYEGGVGGVGTSSTKKVDIRGGTPTPKRKKGLEDKRGKKNLSNVLVDASTSALKRNRRER